MNKILAFSGSTSRKSINQTLIRLLANKVDQHYITVIELNDYQLPIYSPDIEEVGFPEALLQFKAIFDSHDAYIIASPEHNGMMPAMLKNTFDWLSRMTDPKVASMFNNKPVLLLSTSPGARGGSTNLENMVKLMPFWGADVKAHHSFASFHNIYQQGQLIKEQDEILETVINNFQQVI